MPTNTAQFQNLYLKKIDRTFFEAWDEEAEQWSKFLQAETSTQNAEVTQNFAGIAKWNKKDELANPTEQKFKLGDIITTTHQPFAVTVVMSREQVDDSKYKEVENMTRDAGHAGRETLEAECALVLDGAFTVNQYDGVPLCSDSHPNRGDAGGTQDNLHSGALSDATLKTGITLFRQQKDEAGKQILSRPKKLIIHQTKQFLAATILQSSQVAGGQLNDKNLEIVDLDFVASQTAWFLQGARHRMVHYFRVKPEFLREKEMRQNGSWVWNGYFRHSTAIESWRQVVGSTG